MSKGCTVGLGGPLRLSFMWSPHNGCSRQVSPRALSPAFLHLWLPSPVKRKKSESDSQSVVSESLRPLGPLSLFTGFSRQEYWSGLHFLLQEIFLTQGSNPGLLHCRQILYHLSHQGSWPPRRGWPREKKEISQGLWFFCIFGFTVLLHINIPRSELHCRVL